MRILKRKIELAKTSQNTNQEKTQNETQENNLTQEAVSQKPLQTNPIETPKTRRKRGCAKRALSEAYRANKNIAKNYGRKICAFAASPIALPYLKTFIANENVQLKGFINYVQSIKENLDGLSHFRSALLELPNDSNTLKAYKKLFRLISEVFIKFFSVNWIFHSKIFHKEAHLKFRFKMLRRIQSPELFTYMKDPNK